jgi:hypothetical protein
MRAGDLVWGDAALIELNTGGAHPPLTLHLWLADRDSTPDLSAAAHAGRR